MSVLQLGAQLPDGRRDAKDDRPRNRRVPLPVGWLRIPATGRRPDVLGITACRAGVRKEEKREAMDDARRRGGLTELGDRHPRNRRLATSKERD